MTFKHKLSARLALMKDLLVLFLTAVPFACEKPVSLADPGSVVTHVAISPLSIELHSGQTSDFKAVGLTATGDTTVAGAAITWTAAGGSISASGLFTAPEWPGEYRVCAQSPGVLSCALVRVLPNLNAADSLLARLPHAVVAVAVPVEVRQDSSVVVRLLLDPSGNPNDSLAPERAAGMQVEHDTTFYFPNMRAQLVATGADVTPATPLLLDVPSSDRTSWSWVLHPRNPGRQKLWITLGVVGASPAGAQLRVYSIERHYTIRRDWWRTLVEFIPRDLLRIGGVLLTAATLFWAWFKNVKPWIARRRG